VTGQAPAPAVAAVLLAHPAGHSLSPRMHDAAFAAIGVAGRYTAWDVAPAALAEAVARIRHDPTIVGANVTVPHKRSVIPHLDGLTDLAARLGAVNTILKRDGRLVGDNTDAPGFARAVAELGVPLAGTVLVLGAGGAAAAVVAALVDGGARVRIHNRTAERATALALRWSPHGDVAALTDGELAGAARRADWIVNTTTVGMQGGPPGTPLPTADLPARGVVVDLIYRPRTTPLLAAARAGGLVTQDGVAMLVHQGALAFEAWTGRAAPLAVMRGAVEEALAA